MQFKRKHLRVRPAAVLFFLLLPLTSHCQSTAQSQTVLRATTRLVILDVVATDEKGQPVADLKAEDFTVLEDGKPQQLIDFGFQKRGDYTLRLAVVDRHTSLIGTASMKVTVP